jgi:hypothetical protein
VRSQCLQTEIWLCESYKQCAPGLVPRLDAGEPLPGDDGGTDGPDAGADASPAPPRRSSSGCALAAGSPGGYAPLAGALLALLAITGRCRYRAMRRR